MKAEYRRTEYGISCIIYAFIAVKVGPIDELDEFPIIGLVYIPMFWFLLAQGTKRCHDIGHNGWFQIIPFYGFWMLFANGEKGINKYGRNPKTNNMKHSLFLFLFFCWTISYSQSLTESDIKKMAQKISSEAKGIDVGNGITVRNCLATGRTFIYQYDVPSDWYPTENMKNELIQNFKKRGFADLYFNNDINVDFYYFYENSLQLKISISALEFSTFNFKLGDYISIMGHPKAKDVNLKIKQPIGWKLEEGDRPNIVKKMGYKTNYYMIMIKHNIMFVSRKEAKELLTDKDYVKEIISEFSSSLKNVEILKHKFVTIDTYPSLEFTISGTKERIGINIKMIMKLWVIFYEDKIVVLQCASLDGKEFNTLENLYNLITNSVIFPEQYN